MKNKTVDHHFRTMSGAKGRHQALNNRSGNYAMKSKFKGGTPGFEHVVFTYGKVMKQGNWKDHLQLLSGIVASSMKYSGARLT